MLLGLPSQIIYDDVYKNTVDVVIGVNISNGVRFSDVVRFARKLWRSGRSVWVIGGGKNITIKSGINSMVTCSCSLGDVIQYGLPEIVVENRCRQSSLSEIIGLYACNNSGSFVGSFDGLYLVRGVVEHFSNVVNSDSVKVNLRGHRFVLESSDFKHSFYVVVLFGSFNDIFSAFGFIESFLDKIGQVTKFYVYADFLSEKREIVIIFERDDGSLGSFLGVHESGSFILKRLMFDRLHYEYFCLECDDGVLILHIKDGRVISSFIEGVASNEVREFISKNLSVMYSGLFPGSEFSFYVVDPFRLRLFSQVLTFSEEVFGDFNVHKVRFFLKLEDYLKIVSNAVVKEMEVL